LIVAVHVICVNDQLCAVIATLFKSVFSLGIIILLEVLLT
jgi:hypothetical protein